MEHNPYAAPNVDTTLPTTGGTAGAPENWTIGEAISRGWEATWKNPLVLIVGFVVISIIQNGLGQLLQSILGPDPAVVLGSSLLLLPLNIFFTIGEFRVGIAAARGQEVDFGMFFSGGPRLLPALGATIVSYVLILLGFVALIIPGIIISLGLGLIFPLVADTEMGAIETLQESWEKMKGNKLKLFVFGLASALVMLLGFLALILGIFVAIPVIIVAYCDVYLSITGRRHVTA